MTYMRAILREEGSPLFFLWSCLKKKFYLWRLARCWRYLAFCRADPLPWAPVIYFFFLALVFTLPSSSFWGLLRL